MKKLGLLIVLGWIGALLSGCHSSDPAYQKKLEVSLGPVPELVFDRYEETLFRLDTSRFQEELMAIQEQYQPFLEGDLSDPDAINYLKGFAVDPVNIALFDKVMRQYPDLNAVRGLVVAIYRHFSHYYPDIPLPTRIFTCVSGLNPEIPPVFFTEYGLVISLDWYLEGDEIYDRIGMPHYLSERTTIDRLVKDLGEQIYVTYVERRLKPSNLLEEMVYEGRKDFFIEAMYPNLTDMALLGYSKEQLDWAETNEGNLWADMVGNQRLFASDMETYRTFLADGPFTNEYSHEAPPRLGEFIGLHIVRSYMNRHDCSLQDLMETKDLQGIFQDSGYKPQK